MVLALVCAGHVCCGALSLPVPSRPDEMLWCDPRTLHGPHCPLPSSFHIHLWVPFSLFIAQLLSLLTWLKCHLLQ